jgi:hypothetical protein
MKRLFSILALVGLLTGVLAACGTTPAPTIPPPTQTPWIIVVTATPGAERVAETQPTQTPWIIIATPTRTTRATPTATKQATITAGAEANATATPTPTWVRPTATDTPEAENLIYSAPLPLEPPDDAPVSWKATVLIKWSSVGPLATDEYYHLHLDAYREADGEHWYGDYVYTKDTQYLAEGTFLAPFHPSAEQGRAIVYWWVRVVRKTGVDENGRPVGLDISPPSEKHTFIVDPKPGES